MPRPQLTRLFLRDGLMQPVVVERSLAVPAAVQVRATSSDGTQPAHRIGAIVESPGLRRQPRLDTNDNPSVHFTSPSFLLLFSARISNSLSLSVAQRYLLTILAGAIS